MKSYSDFEARSSGSYIDSIDFRQSHESMEETKPDPAWQSAWRFASAIRKQGFIPKKHFIDRLAQRGIGEGVRFDPRTFRREFFSAQHYKQTRPGYNTRIAIVRGIPVLYRLGGQRGDTVVLAGALPEGALPPVEKINPPPERETFEQQQEIEHEGPYAHLDGKDRTLIEPGRDFTAAQKARILAANMRRNGGALRSDDPADPYQVLRKPERSVSRGMGGTGQPPDMASVDHIIPQSKGGPNSYGNAQVISITHNRNKRNK
jgi:hypothetical protein